MLAPFSLTFGAMFLLSFEGLFIVHTINPIIPATAGTINVIALTKTFAIKAGKYNINVNAIAPGPTITKMAVEPGWDKEVPDNPLG